MTVAANRFPSGPWLVLGLLLFTLASPALAEPLPLASAKLPKPLSRIAAVSNGTHIFGFGGLGVEIGHQPSDLIWRYDPGTDALQTLQPRLPDSTQGMSAVWTGRYVFLFGGATNQTYLDGVLRYEPATDTLAAMTARFPTPRAYTSAAFDETHAYVFGGFSQTSQQGTLYEGIFRYNLTADTLAPMNARLPSGRTFTAAAAVGSEIYIFGGSDRDGNLDEIVRFTPSNDTVQRMAAKLPTPRYGVAAAAAGSHIYVYGGQTPEANDVGVLHDDVLQYDPSADRLTELPQTLPTPRSSSAAVFDGRNLLVIGGNDIRKDVYGAQQVVYLDEIVRHRVNLPPVAAFDASVEGLTVRVDASRSTDPDGTLEAYAWDWGDGSGGNGAVASHTFASGANRTIRLTVTDSDGATATASQVVSFANQPPIASFTVRLQRLSATVDGSASRDAEGPIASYRWDWGDSSVGEGVVANHTFAQAGTYVVQLTVSDGSGLQGTLKRTINVSTENQPPVAAINLTYRRLNVTADASGSSDIDGTLAEFAWDWGDGASGAGPLANHTYARAGTYTVTLRVRDQEGAVSETSVQATPDASNKAPQAALSLQVDRNRVSADGAASDDPDGEVVNWSWDWGDGGNSTGSQGVHEYAAAGTYAVTLTVVDNDGARATANESITVQELPRLNADFTVSQRGLTVAADARQSTVPAGPGTYEWSWGDGERGEGPTATHAYARDGTYDIRLTLTDANGMSVSAERTVSVASEGSPAQPDAGAQETPGPGMSVLVAALALAMAFARRRASVVRHAPTLS